MPELFFKHARTKNTPKIPKTLPVEPSQQIIYELQIMHTMASYLLRENANFRKWLAEELCPKIPYDLVPPPVTIAENLPPEFWLQGPSLQTIQTMNYYTMLDSANLRKWTVEELCAKTGLPPPPSVFDYNAVLAYADRA
jgi:hypothetical protein